MKGSMIMIFEGNREWKNVRPLSRLGVTGVFSAGVNFFFGMVLAFCKCLVEVKAGRKFIFIFMVLIPLYG